MPTKTEEQLRAEYEAASMNTLVTTPIAAAAMRLSHLTLARWRSVGKGPEYVKVGGRVLYRKRVIELMLAGGVRA